MDSPYLPSYRLILDSEGKLKPRILDVRNGRNTSFWFDEWSIKGRIFDLTGPRGYIDMGIPAQATVESVIRTHRRRNHRVETLNGIEAEIMRLRQHDSREEDIYQCGRIRRISSQTKLIRRGLGVCSVLTPKYAFLLWLAIHNRLSTGDRIWDPGVRADCVLCTAQEETINHLFFSCTFAAQIWTALTTNLLVGDFSRDWDRIVPLLSNSNYGKIKLLLLRYVW